MSQQPLSLEDVVRMFDSQMRGPPIELACCMRCGMKFDTTVEALQPAATVGTFVTIGCLCRVCTLLVASAEKAERHRQADGTWERQADRGNGKTENVR